MDKYEKRKCAHPENKQIILKQYRPNKSYGKFKRYGIPKKCADFCTNCNTRFESWRPAQ